jgi:predicted XRE-type DNA-binding protein
MTIDYGIERDLRAIPAEKELLQLKLLRAVGKATDEGVPQRTIAVMLGVAQPEVSRIVKKLRLNPAARDRSPREVMLEHAGGRISREQMISELAGWEYTFGRVAVDDPVGQSYQRGSWDQIERAGDLLTDEDRRVLFEVTASRRAQANAL